jgi:hypothetical protein
MSLHGPRSHGPAQRLSVDGDGLVILELKRAFTDGTTPVLFEPVDFSRSRYPASRDISASMHVIARLAALVPRPRAHLVRYHVLFAPNAHGRARAANASEHTLCCAPR